MRIVLLGACALLALQTASAQDTQPPSEAAVKQLFEVMHTQTLLDGYIGQVDQMMQQSMRQALKGAQVNAEQQQILDDMRGEFIGLFKEQLNWSSLEPTVIDVYRRTFSAAEIEGMRKFYSSPTGQAVVTKLPVAMQQMMQAMQQRMVTLMPQIAQLQKDTAAALERAAKRNENAPVTSPPSTSESASPGAPSPPSPAPPPAPQPAPSAPAH
jgi:uncharacterized protein